VDGYYKLEDEFTTEKYTFEIDDCKIAFDFRAPLKIRYILPQKVKTTFPNFLFTSNL